MCVNMIYVCVYVCQELHTLQAARSMESLLAEPGFAAHADAGAGVGARRAETTHLDMRGDKGRENKTKEKVEVDLDGWDRFG